MKPLNVSLRTCVEYYHEKDPVFGKNGNSKWHGKGCKNFDLEGKIIRQDFLNLLQGKSPKDKLQLVKINRGRKNRVCVDIPFAAPKSVSVMAIYANDKRLLKAHQEAVRQTLKYLEKNYINTRKTKDKNTVTVKGGKALFATFDHSTNRENDPHLHTHTLIMNMVKTKDGYRALCNDKIFKDQKLLTSVYRSFLREKVRELGYQIKNRSNGWDISGFRKEWIKTFSKRRQKIKQEKEVSKSLGTCENDRISFLKTRKDKNLDISHGELIEFWNSQVNLGEIIFEIEQAKNQSKDFDPRELTLDEKIRLVTGIIHENEATFNKVELLKLTMEELNMNINEAQKFFKKAITRNSIVHIKDIFRKGLVSEVYSTPKMIDAEQNILKLFAEGKNKIESKIKKSRIKESLKKEFEWLTPDQKKVVNHVLNTKDQFSIIQGDAGTGKTACMLAVKNIIDQQIENINYPPITKEIIHEHNIKGMGFTGKSAVELEEGAKLKSQTIHSFLADKSTLENECEKKNIKLKDLNFQQLWIVDESSMVGSLQMEKIVKKAEKENAKVVFIGDSKQLQAIGAGKMFSELQKIKTVKTIKMEEVLRQKTVSMQKTVRFLKNYMEKEDPTSLESAFKLLDDRKCIKSSNDMAEDIGKEFVEDFNKSNTLVLCSDNETKDNLNEGIRAKLKQEQKIGDKEKSFLCRTPFTISNLEKFYAGSYEIEAKAFISSKENAGTEVTLKDINKEKNLLIFEDRSRNRIKLNPFNLLDESISISLFKEEHRKFTLDDKVVFRKNDKLLNIQNGLTGRITKMHDGILTILTEKNKIVKISEKAYAYIDYGYAVTTHKSQGQTCDKVLYAVKNKQEFINKTENLYVAVTRAKQDVKIYTDNYKQIKTHFLRRQKKTTTLEKGLYR